MLAKERRLQLEPTWANTLYEVLQVGGSKWVSKNASLMMANSVSSAYYVSTSLLAFILACLQPSLLLFSASITCIIIFLPLIGYIHMVVSLILAIVRAWEPARKEAPEPSCKLSCKHPCKAGTPTLQALTNYSTIITLSVLQGGLQGLAILSKACASSVTETSNHHQGSMHSGCAHSSQFLAKNIPRKKKNIHMKRTEKQY